jgi:3-deoxy-D-manno-octulosonate 8-phosphate phosphatase (KDO 8-P phosphatase)
MSTVLAPDAELARIRMLSCDVDGVLTDGGLYYDEHGGELRRFHVLDGLGMQALQASGVAVCIISRSSTRAIIHRAERLGIEHCLVGVNDKLPALRQLVGRLGIDLDDVAHVADDVNDIELLRAVGVPIAVANAVPEVREVCRLITTTPGGNGAVREVADAILMSRNLRAIT